MKKEKSLKEKKGKKQKDTEKKAELKKQKEDILKESIKKELEKKPEEISFSSEDLTEEFSRLRIPEFSQFERGSSSEDSSDFRPEDVLMKERILVGGGEPLEEVVEEEAPTLIKTSSDFYSSKGDLITYNKKDEAYVPSEDKGPSSIDTGGYKASNKDNYDIAQREAERGGTGREFYDPTERVEPERVGEIRVNTFKDNLESAASQNRKKNDFKFPTY